MDIEGGEWGVLNDYIASSKPMPFTQILIEVLPLTTCTAPCVRTVVNVVVVLPSAVAVTTMLTAHRAE